MTAYMIYKCGSNYIDELCCTSVDLTKLCVFIPHIGETFIDKKRGVEYEVADVIRIYEPNNEYGIQVMLKQREKRKYEVCKSNFMR